MADSMSNVVDEALREVSLPEDVRFYDCHGQRVFPMYGASGGLQCSYYLCLVRHEPPKWFGSGIIVNLSDTHETIKTKIAEALTGFVEFSADGGQLPMPQVFYAAS